MLIVHENLDTASNWRDVVQAGSFFGHVSCALCGEHRFAHFHAGHTDPVSLYYVAAICEPCAEHPDLHTLVARRIRTLTLTASPGRGSPPAGSGQQCPRTPCS